MGLDTDLYHLALQSDVAVKGDDPLVLQLAEELRRWRGVIAIVDLKFNRTAPDVYNYVVNFDGGRKWRQAVTIMGDTHSSTFNQIDGAYVEGELVPSVTNVRRFLVRLARLYGIETLDITWS